MKEEMDFNDAVKLLEAIEGHVSHNNATAAIMLRLYGLYKQKMEGDIMESVPTSKDIVILTKFHSWKSFEGMSKKVATLQYISVVQQLVKQTEITQNQRRERAELSWKIFAILIAVMSIVMLLQYQGIEIILPPTFNRVESTFASGLAIARSTAERYRMTFDLYHVYWGSGWMFGRNYLRRMFSFLHSSQSLLGIEHLSSPSVSIMKDKKSKAVHGNLEYTPSHTPSNQNQSTQSGYDSLMLLLQLSFGTYLLTTMWLYNTKQRRIAYYQRLSDFFASLLRFCFTANTTTKNITTTKTAANNITTNNSITSNINNIATKPTKASYSPAIRSPILLIPSYFTALKLSLCNLIQY